MKLLYKTAFLIGTALFSMNSIAVTGAILEKDQVSSAEIASLSGEAALFETIRKGIALTIATCAADQPCTPSVNRDEVQKIIATLGERINSLTLRYEENKDPELEDILISYVDVLDGYSSFMEKLDTIMPAEETFGLDEEFDDSDIFSTAVKGKSITEKYGIFEDVEEEIEDDEEFAPLPSDEEIPAAEETPQE